jgi:hypothetical protein
MPGVIMSILVLFAANPRVAPDRMSTFTFSGGYGNRTGSNVGSGSIALRTNLVAHLSRSLEAGLDGGFYYIEQEQYPGGEEYPLKQSIIHAGIIGRYLSQGSKWRIFLEIGSGYYSWNQNFLGYSAGGGMRYYPGGSNQFYFLEGKWHDNIQHLCEPSPGFYSITAGLGSSW